MYSFKIRDRQTSVPNDRYQQSVWE